MSFTYDNSDINPERLAYLEALFQRSKSFIPYSHNRGNSGDIAGAGDQFRPPRPQTSWPRHVEIAPEDLEPQHSAAGDLAVELISTPRPHTRRIGQSRGGSRSTPYLASAFRYQPYSEDDVALFIEQRDRSQDGVARDGPSSETSFESVTAASSPAMSEDDDESSSHTPTQANTTILNASQPSTPPPRSVASTEDGCENLQEDFMSSSPPWSSQKRKRVDSPDDNDNV